MNDLEKRTWAEVYPENIKHNYSIIRKHIPENCKFLGIVKADAYGHGALVVSKILQDIGADYLAVSCLDEAMELRNGGIHMPILILGHTPPEYTSTLIDNNITQSVSNLSKAMEYSQEASVLGKVLKIHIKVDTGMSRLGFLVNGAVENIKEACSLPGLEHEGIFTHFSVSDETEDSSSKYTYMQFYRFMNIIDDLKETGITFSIRHCANSGAIVNYPEMCLDMVRPGILMYGYGDRGLFKVKPCMRLVSTISTIKHFESGTDVSYGRHFTTQRRTRMGVVAIGYADGLHRASSNKCSYYIEGQLAPQCGNVCMDMCMVDLTDVKDAHVGSQVELFGPNCDIYQLSDASLTIPDEILCSITKRVPREYK